MTNEDITPSDPREAPKTAPPLSDERLLFRLRLFVEVETSSGQTFYEAEYQTTYHDQSRDGVVALEQTLVDLLSAQVELGRQAARLHSGQ